MIPKERIIRYLCVAILLSSIMVMVSCSSKEEKAVRHLERAKEYISKNELDKAVIELKNVVQLNPKNDSALFDLGETYLKLKQGREAFQAFSQAASINPDNLKAQLKVGQILLLGRQTAEARKRAELILEKSPEDIEALSLFSGIQVQEKDLDSAIKTLEKAASVNPKHFNTQLSMGRLLLLKGDVDKAEKAYVKAVTLDPSSHVPYIELSRIYGSKGEWDRAEAELKKMIQGSGATPQNLSVLGAYYESRKEWEQAEKMYIEAVNTAPKEDVTPLMNLGSYYARRNSYDQALETINKALALKKDDPNILLSMAQLQFDFRKVKEAEGTVDRVLEKDKGNVGANFLKGRIELSRNEYPQALERFDLVLKERPRSDLAYYSRALALLGKGEQKLAQQDLLKAVELNPALLDARLILAEFYLRERNKELARQQIDVALRLAPEHVRVLMLQGNLKILEGDAGGSVAIFEKVVAKMPEDAPSHVRLGLVYNLTGKHDMAIKSFSKALELNPMQTDALGLLVSSYVRDKKFEEALSACEKNRGKIEKNPANLAMIEFLEGNIFLAMRDLKKAQDRFEKAIETDPNLPGPYITLAGIYVAEKKFDQAIKQYETIIGKNPKYLAGYMTIGVIYDQLGKGDDAEKYYRKALEINKEFAPAANNLAWSLAERGKNIDEALGLAQTAKEKMPKSAAVMDTLGWIYYLKGSYLNAISEFQESVALDPENPVINYHLGMAYYKDSRNKEAVTFLEKALKINQTFKGADEARNILKEIEAKS